MSHYSMRNMSRLPVYDVSAIRQMQDNIKNLWPTYNISTTRQTQGNINLLRI